ncbi:MAG TPA: hypothetical protein VLT58_11645 [Polyangia bacterium]|nr:hypothetical protein [Polyangia bacterium]
MRIELRKITDQQHELVLIRDGGCREALVCETRSSLVHDLLHYAAEQEAGVQTGFWGTLASGRTLADMNDRTGAALGDAGPDVMAIERIMGPLAAAAKGAAPDALASRLRAYLAETGDPAPDWLTPAFIAAVQERLRHLLGAWRAVPHGETLRLDW